LEQPLLARFLTLSLAAAILGVGIIALVVHHSPRGRGPALAFAVPPSRDRIVVEVLNGTTRPGLARVGTRWLRREGIDVVFLGNAEEAAESTLVISRRGPPALAERVAHGLGVGKVVTAADTLRRVDVTVILGADYRPPSELHP